MKKGFVRAAAAPGAKSVFILEEEDTLRLWGLPVCCQPPLPARFSSHTAAAPQQ